MIRFIDLTGQTLPDAKPAFAFFNAETNQFLSIDGVQTWENADEFSIQFLTGIVVEGFEAPPWRRVSASDAFEALIPERFKPAAPLPPNEVVENAVYRHRETGEKLCASTAKKREKLVDPIWEKIGDRPHFDDDFSYICGGEWCRCMQ